MFGLAVVVFALDRITKVLVESYVSVWDTYVVVPHLFNIIHSKNRGAAFGILADAPGEWRTFFLVGLTLIVLVFVASLLWQTTSTTSKDGRWLRLALALVLGGALGNIYDRIFYGMVTDFLDLYLGSYHWHTFNIADSAITLGSALLIFDLWQGRTHKARA